MGWCVSVAQFTYKRLDPQVNDIHDWCNKQFGPADKKTYHLWSPLPQGNWGMYQLGGYVIFHFNNKEYATMFKMRWGAGT